MGIEEIISQQLFWCFGASQTLYNGRTLEPKLQDPTWQFLDHNNWGILSCHRNETLWQASCLSSGFSFWFPFLCLLQSNADWNLVEYLIFSITHVEQHKFKIQSIILQDLQWESIAKFTRKSIVLSFASTPFVTFLMII